MKYPVSHLTPFPPIFPHVPRANSLLAFTPNPPLCQARRMPLCFHHLTNPSLPQPFCIDFLVIHFQLLTNPFSRNPFTFTSIQNPRVSPLVLSNFDCRQLGQSALREGATFSIPRRSSAERRLTIR